jgi:thioredoxin-related protein
MFALLRHYQVAIIVLMQSYNKLPRALRINSNATIVFPSTQSEVEVLLDEITPSGLSKKQFLKVIEYCTDGRYDFLYINNHAEPDKRIRKNFDEVIDIKKYKV